MNDMTNAMLQEVELQKDFLNEKIVSSIYFGGGTPSLLTADTIKKMIGKISEYYILSDNAEITLEANPDDLTKKKLTELSNTPVNRLSIGVQSFLDKDLQFMNRAHSAAEAEHSILQAQDAGFENITADLIYGIPSSNNEEWENNISKMLELNVPHISAYSLTIEPGTLLAYQISRKKINAPDNARTSLQMEILMNEMRKRGFIHYEISSFSKNEGSIAKHNSSYWKRKPYLGIGPSAHSFNEEARQWNVANNTRYIRSLQQKKIPAETEQLSPSDIINEKIMLGLRTIWGIDLNKTGKYYDQILNAAAPFLQKGQMVNQNNNLFLTDKGKLFADEIAAEMFPDQDR